MGQVRWKISIPAIGIRTTERPDFDVVGVVEELDAIERLETLPDYFGLVLADEEDSIASLSHYSSQIPLLVSCRRDASLGIREKDSCLNDLVRAADYEWVELELATVEENPAVIDELREKGVELLVSYYNHKETPPASELRRIIDDCSNHGDIVKVCTFANAQDEALLLLESIKSASSSGLRICGYSIGPLGKHTRVIGVFHGSELCFAPISVDSQGSAQGEIELAELSELLESVVHGGDAVELMDELQGTFPGH